MRQQTKEVRNGLKFGPINEPATPEEFDQLAGKVGACVDEANDNIWYRSVLPDVWYGLALRLNKEYGTTFDMKDGPAKKDGTPTKVRAKSDPQHVDFIASQQNVSATTFQAFVDEIIKDGYDEAAADGTVKHYTVEFDPKAREHVAGPAKPGKGDLEMAAKFVAQGPEKLHITLGKISHVTGQPATVDGLEGEALTNRVALHVRDYRLAIARTATAGLMNDEPATPKKAKK